MAPSPARLGAAAAALLRSGRWAGEAWTLLDRLTPEHRERAQAWVTDLLREQTLRARITRTVGLADDLAPGTGSVEEKEAAERYAARARALAQALDVADALRGGERRRRRTEVRERTTELQSEMVAFLLQRGTVA